MSVNIFFITQYTIVLIFMSFESLVLFACLILKNQTTQSCKLQLSGDKLNRCIPVLAKSSMLN